MTTMELEARKTDIIRSVLEINSSSLLDKLMKFISREQEKEAEAAMSKEEILADFSEACRELKLRKEGKVKFKTLEEALDEL